VKPSGTIQTAPIDIARQFVAANRGLRPDMMSVTCRRGHLQEVRICFSKDLRGFTPCPEVARQNCRAGEVTIEAAR
jgi:ribonuclease T2